MLESQSFNKYLDMEIDNAYLRINDIYGVTYVYFDDR